jgi:hypothetical protein
MIKSKDTQKAKTHASTVTVNIREVIRRYESRRTDERVLVCEEVREFTARLKRKDIKRRGFKVALSAWKAGNLKGGR